MAATGSVCDFDAADLAQALADQNSVIKLAFTENIAYNDPYSNVVFQDTFKSGYGETQIRAVTPRISMNQSSVRPAFTNFKASCLTPPRVTGWGNQRYTAVPGILSLQSQPICVKQQYFVVSGLLESSVGSLKEGITDLVSWDIRANLLDLSGMKFVVPSPGGTPESGLTGSEWAVSTNFNGLYPGDRLTFRYAKWLRDKIAYRFRPPMFGKGADAHAILITSDELNDALRSDAPLNSSLVAATTGGYNDGKDGLWAYSFIDSNFRGLKFAIDTTPLRFDTLDANGNPQLIEAYEEVATNDEGVTWAIRSEWENANYEVWFMLFSRTAFARLTPENFAGEDGAKFPTGMFGGELEWWNERDSCNRWGDMGFFQARIVRVMLPQFPHFVLAGISKRCRGPFTDNTDTCPDITDSDVTI